MACNCESLEAKLSQIEQLVITQNQQIADLLARIQALESASYTIDVTQAIKQAFGVS
jgi:hypothetical protein